MSGDNICTAGVEPNSGKTIRPLFSNSYDDCYLTLQECRKQNIQLGSLVSFDLEKKVPIKLPHSEDHISKAKRNFQVIRLVEPDEFEGVLHSSTFNSVSAGFDNKIPTDEKFIPETDPSNKSLIAINPMSIQVQVSTYESNRLLVHFEDQERRYSYVKLTDIGLHNFYNQSSDKEQAIKKIEDAISKQNRIYLRIGLGRVHQVGDGPRAYYLQVNGIYTFPEYLVEARFWEL